jgi:hypothetical protein
MELQQASNVAMRMRRRRQRKRSGLVVFSFEGDEIEIPEILVEAGFLSPADSENRDAVSQALARWFAAITKEG